MCHIFLIAYYHTKISECTVYFDICLTSTRHQKDGKVTFKNLLMSITNTKHVAKTSIALWQSKLYPKYAKVINSEYFCHYHQSLHNASCKSVTANVFCILLSVIFSLVYLKILRYCCLWNGLNERTQLKDWWSNRLFSF